MAAHNTLNTLGYLLSPFCSPTVYFNFFVLFSGARFLVRGLQSLIIYFSFVFGHRSLDQSRIIYKKFAVHRSCLESELSCSLSRVRRVIINFEVTAKSKILKLYQFGC